MISAGTCAFPLCNVLHVTRTFAVEHSSDAVVLCFVFWSLWEVPKARQLGVLRVFLKGGRPPPPNPCQPVCCCRLCFFELLSLCELSS